MDTKKNYKDWSFRFFLYLIALNMVVFYQVINEDKGSLSFILTVIFATIFWIGGIAFTILSHIRNEIRDYKYKVSVWGFLILTIFPLVIEVVIYLIKI